MKNVQIRFSQVMSMKPALIFRNSSASLFLIRPFKTAINMVCDDFCINADGLWPISVFKTALYSGFGTLLLVQFSN